MGTVVESFLTSAQEQRVIEAIRLAEKQTSGEIRVHIESYTGEDIFKHAQEVFHLLKMDNTKEGNGVILYVAVNLKKFVIYGDTGINKLVGADFWNSTRDLIQQQFKQGKFDQGLINGIQEIGRVLKQYFPWDSNDENELPNEISKPS